MTEAGFLLKTLVEECAEVIQACCKAERFGLLDTYLETTPQEQIIHELNDLLGAIELCVEAGIIPRDWEDGALIFAKKVKVRHFLEYSRKKGLIEE